MKPKKLYHRRIQELGRVAIPPELLQKLDLEYGKYLEMEEQAGEIILRPMILKPVKIKRWKNESNIPKKHKRNS